MTFGEFAQVLTAIGVLGGVVVSWRNGRKLDVQGEKIADVHKATNGLTHELTELTAKSSKAEGKKEAEDEAKDERLRSS